MSPVWFRPMRRFEASPTTPAGACAAPPNGRALVAQLGDNQFLVTGLYSRIGFQTAGDASKKPWQYLSVEEGEYENGVFKSIRILNGDQTDWGLFFGSESGGFAGDALFALGRRVKFHANRIWPHSCERSRFCTCSVRLKTPSGMEGGFGAPTRTDAAFRSAQSGAG